MAQPVHTDDVTPAEALPGGRLDSLLDSLLDSWSLLEHADGVLVVRGRVGLVELVAFATDGSRQGGALGQEGCAAVARAVDRAVRLQQPVVGLWHSGGARLGE